MEKQGNLKEYVYNAVLDDILSGTYSPGAILNEKALIEKYDCSKSPVREALIQLSAENVLRNIPRYGYEVVRLTTEDISEMLEFRSILESELIAGKLQQYTEEDIREIEEINERCKINETDARTHWSYNMEFHLRLVKRAGNTYAYEELRRCLSRLTRAYAQLRWNQNVDLPYSKDTQHHEEIIECLKMRDEERLRRCLREDLGDFSTLKYFYHHKEL